MKKLSAAAIKTGKNVPPRLIAIGREVEAKVSKFQTYETKAADMAVSIKQLLAEAATYCDQGGFAAFRKRHCPSLGKSRAYELLAIASGKKSAEQSKAQGAARQARHVAKLKAAAATMRSVSDGKTYPARVVSNSEDEGARQFTALVLRLLLLIQGQPPERYAATGVVADDLNAVARFLGEVAAAASRKLKATG